MARTAPYIVVPDDYANLRWTRCRQARGSTRSRRSRSTADPARSASRPSTRRRLRRARARAARRHREPGQARDLERPRVQRARADVPLHGRGARERARGEGRVHPLARALDHRHVATRRPELGSARWRLKRLELGALFHDIGKIGIPASILLKPGRSTTTSALLIETHPELGERILARSSSSRDVRPIVRACHERWDGKGYPDGLGGDEIPIEARIIFACDAFHAMTTDRPYRERLPSRRRPRGFARRPGRSSIRDRVCESRSCASSPSASTDLRTGRRACGSARQTHTVLVAAYSPIPQPRLCAAHARPRARTAAASATARPKANAT